MNGIMRSTVAALAVLALAATTDAQALKLTSGSGGGERQPVVNLDGTAVVSQYIIKTKAVRFTAATGSPSASATAVTSCYARSTRIAYPVSAYDRTRWIATS